MVLYFSQWNLEQSSNLTTFLVSTWTLCIELKQRPSHHSPLGKISPKEQNSKYYLGIKKKNLIFNLEKKSLSELLIYLPGYKKIRVFLSRTENTIKLPQNLQCYLFISKADINTWTRAARLKRIFIAQVSWQVETRIQLFSISTKILQNCLT